MRALNTSRVVRIRYPRNTPRVSRKRVWMDRSEWRESPEAVRGLGEGLIDQQMANARSTPDLSGTDYKGLPDLAVRAGRIGILRG
jgi:hypothetical protein